MRHKVSSKSWLLLGSSAALRCNRAAVTDRHHPQGQPDGTVNGSGTCRLQADGPARDCRPSRPARPAPAGQPDADRPHAGACQRRAMEPRVRAVLSLQPGPPTVPGGVRPRSHRFAAARPSGRLSAHHAAERDLERNGHAQRRLRCRGRQLATPAPHGDGGLRSEARERLFSVAAEGHPAPARPLAEGGAVRATDRPAGRSDALHRRRHRRPGLRRRGEHAGVEPRSHSAPPRQDLPGDLPAHPFAVSVLALRQVAGRPRA